MNLKIFKPTFLRNLNMLSLLIILNGSLVVIYFCLFGFNPQINIVYYVIAFKLITDVIPTIWIHIQYYTNDRRSELTVDSALRNLIYSKNGVVSKYNFDEITSYTIYSSFGGRTFWYSFGEYRYCRICFTGGQQIVVTCLMVPKIVKTMESVLGKAPVRKYSMIAFIKKTPCLDVSVGSMQ